MEVNNEIHIVTEPLTSTACPKCGAVLDVTNRRAFEGIKCAACSFQFEVPARFGNFLLLKFLGMGGMGGVYRARDEALNREVAIKVMQKRYGDDPTFIANFQREAQSAAKLNHPNIAQIYSFGQALGQPFIVMELLSGGSLDRMMADQGPLDPAAVMLIGQQIAEGLREAAEAGLVHGDVKPENILFDNDKNAKLLDFGLAAMSNAATTEIWGTPFYIPPEKVKKQPTDLRSDIYSLGATLYHAIAGVPPFDGTDVAAVVKARFISDPAPLRNLRGSVVPEEVDSIILRMMDKEPSKRYPTYGSLLSDMRRYLSKAGPVNLASSSKKIMIKGKRPQSATTPDIPANPTSPLPSTDAAPKKGKPSFTFSKKSIEPSAASASATPGGNKLQEEFAAMDAQRRKAQKLTGMIIGGVVTGIVLVVGLIVFAVVRNEENRKKQEAADIVKAQDTATGAIKKAVTEASKFVAYIKESELQAIQYANQARDMVLAAAGDEVRERLVPQEPTYVIPVFGEEETPASGVASTNAPAASRSSAVTNAPAATNVPAATATLKKEPESNKTGKAFEVVDPDNDQEKNKYPVVKSVRNMYLEAYRVKYAALLSAAMFAEIERLSLQAPALKSPNKVRELTALANTIAEKFRTMGFTRELTEVARNVSGLKRSFDSVKAESATLAVIKKQEALEKERIRKREEDEARKIKEAEELAARVKADCEKVAGVEVSNVLLLKSMRFDSAMRKLRLTEDELTTDGGKEALMVALERVRRIEEAIKFILNNIQGYKSPKGWLIEAVEPKTLTVSSKKITWEEVFTSRMEVVNELFNVTIMNSELTKNMRVRERTRLEVSGALFLLTYYREIPAAVERVKKVANDATKEFPSDGEKNKMLMPGLID
jgi:serine/threonine protein kinase